jgi:MoxR-like ATPase
MSDTPITTPTSCTSCPLYVTAAQAKVEGAYGPLQYFGMCRGTGRFINATAAKSLPGTPHCPITVAKAGGATIGPDGEGVHKVLGAGLANAPWKRVYLKGETPVEIPAERTPARSCAGCEFFVEKGAAPGSAGTPAARFDSCAVKGSLIKPGERVSTAATCTVSNAGARNTHASEVTPLSLYRDASLKERVTESIPAFVKAWRDPESDPLADTRRLVEAIEAERDLGYAEAPAPAPTKDRADKAADLSRDAFDALLDPTTYPTYEAAKLDKAAKAAKLDKVAKAARAMGEAAEAAAEVVEALPTPDGKKALPARPKTGMVYLSDTYSMPYPLPEGSVGVVAVRATSRASDVVWLPRYDENGYPEDVRADIPAEEGLYIDHSDLLYRMAVAYLTDHVAALWGDAGVGKTEGVEHIARLTRQPFARISVKWATQVDDLIGRWALREGSMEWIDGRFTKAWRGGYITCVDEPNCGKDEVWQALRAPFDGAKILVLDEKDGERIPRHSQSRVFAAMNPGWDPRFVGTQPVNDADLDRLQHITVPYPPEAVERAILEAKAPWVDAATITKMLAVARDIRKAVEASSIRISFGVRKTLKWADLLRYMGPVPAFRQAVTEWMPPKEARLLTDIVDANF